MDRSAPWSGETGAPNDGDVQMLCQTTADDSALAGDSGSPVFRYVSGGDVQLLGILWGGNDFHEDWFYSPIGSVESELGALTAAETNLKPTIEITTPVDGGSLGSGAFFSLHAEATFWDFEDGVGCSACEVKWLSTKDGLLGISPVLNGTATVDANISGTGKRLIIAVAKDRRGAQMIDYVEVSTGNSAPNVWIEWPPNGAQLYAGIPYLLQGDSFDDELFHALPCSALSWSSDVPTPLPSTPQPLGGGCNLQTVFNQLGARAIYLTGDDGGASGSAASFVTIVPAPANVGPTVLITEVRDLDLNSVSSMPALVDPTHTIRLQAQATDPDGKTPISFTWTLVGTQLQSGNPQDALGTTSAANGATTSINWTPGGSVLANCGGTPVTVRVVGTDPDGQTGFVEVDISVAYAPC